MDCTCFYYWHLQSLVGAPHCQLIANHSRTTADGIAYGIFTHVDVYCDHFDTNLTWRLPSPLPSISRSSRFPSSKVCVIFWFLFWITFSFIVILLSFSFLFYNNQENLSMKYSYFFIIWGPNCSSYFILIFDLFSELLGLVNNFPGPRNRF